LHKLHFNQVTENLRHLLAPLDFNLAVTSILSGDTPGVLFVDEPDQPSTALAWFKHRFFLARSAGFVKQHDYPVYLYMLED
jgi:hypothetical protein